MPAVRLRHAALAALMAAALAAVACGGGADDSWSARAIAADPDAPLQPVLASSQLAIGDNRLAFGFFDRSGALLSEGEATLRIFRLDGDSGELVSEHQLTPVSLTQSQVHTHTDGDLHTHSGPLSTIFVTNARFDAAGIWGAELSVTAGSDRVESRIRFNVFERTSEPMLGEQVPRSAQRVLRDVDDISEIDTSNPPEPGMHDETVAEALDTGRPVVVAFATPAFCQSRFCGPVIDEVVHPLYERYRDQAEFVHIEPFDIAEARAGRLVVMPVMAEWGLTTEPWVFVLDGSGRVAAKFEGITSMEEVDAALSPLLGAR